MVRYINICEEYKNLRILHRFFSLEVDVTKCGSGQLFFSGKEKIMPVTKEQVDQLIASDTVVIFSKTTCPYCTMAKQVFNKLQQKYTTIELDQRDDWDEIQTILGEMTGARTVPRVFVKGICLGGGKDIVKLYETGELQKKL
ncbi:uncharacterized protein LOC143183479 isoform X2 [Calliopsis andreniformis]|uniref:uncharacterized protein LOC143183479 isoform X2 n=1 Tax=Calliopsis andreniformis TaxID=337506 RepID=UPI003FCDF7A4